MEEVSKYGWPIPGNGRSVFSICYALDEGGRVLKWSATPTSAPNELTAKISLPNLRYSFR